MNVKPVQFDDLVEKSYFSSFIDYLFVICVKAGRFMSLKYSKSASIEKNLIASLEI